MRARFLDWGFFLETKDFIQKPYRAGKRIRKLKRMAA